MGIPEAKKVYESTYGVDAKRVIRIDDDDEEEYGGVFRFKKQNQQTLRDADFSLDLVDLPTYNISDLTILGRDIASNILKGQEHMGQMLLFVNKNNGQTVDCLYDEHNTITEDDISCLPQNRAQQSVRSSIIASTRDSKNVVTRFYNILNQFEDKIKVAVKRVPVIIPTSQAKVNRLIEPPLKEMMMSPPAENHKMTDYESVNYWLNKHEVIKKRQVLTSAMLMASTCNGWNDGGHIYVTPQSRFRDAFYASEMEGLILLSAFRMVRVIRNLLKSKNSKGRYTVFFMDGQSPAIKKITRKKRQEKRKVMIDNKKKKLDEDGAAAESLFHSCKRMMIRIPQGLMTTALMDVMRTPLVKSTGSKGLYLSTASFSEAEDDIVRLVSCMLDLETPGKHFSLLKKKGLVEYDTYNTFNGKKTVKWDDLYSLLKTHTIDEKQKVTVNIFSHDSDVLAKWNLMVSHHKSVCNVMNMKYKSGVKLKELNFYRSVLGGGSNNNNNNIVAGKKSGGHTVYDLSESPVSLTPESTIVIMLTKGSDYNTSLVSDGCYDTQIRREVAMFEKLSCTCISGWKVFFDERKYFEKIAVDKNTCGNVSEYNMSRSNCEVCSKKIVMPFWVTKFAFLAQAVDFVYDPRHLCFPPADKELILSDVHSKLDLHRALAANASANVMAFLTLGCFNQRIFGSINTLGNIIKHLSQTDKQDEEMTTAIPAVADKTKKDGQDLKKDFAVTLNAIINKKKRKNDIGNIEDIINEATKKKSVRKKKRSPINLPLSLSIYNSVIEFFNFHTDGGITTCSEDDLIAEKSFLFDNTFDKASDRFYKNSEKSDIEMASHEFLKTIFGQDGDDDMKSVRDDDDDDDDFSCSSNDNDSSGGGGWLGMARKVFEKKKNCRDGNGSKGEKDFFANHIETTLVAPTSLVTCLPTSQSLQQQPCVSTNILQASSSSKSVELESDLKYENILSWEKLAEEFEKCLSVKNIDCGDCSLLTTMSGLLMAGAATTVSGIDDIRTSGVPYMIKTMNLLMIVYLNMCGLEDNRIVIGHGQLMPIIHSEYYAGEACNNDRTNFMAAVLEYTMMQYRPEIGPASSIRQCKRQKWEPLLARMSVLDEYTDICNRNCLTLSRATADTMLTWVPFRGYFMPVLGLAIPKPWTPLSLWASFLHCKQQQNIIKKPPPPSQTTENGSGEHY